MLLPLDDVPNGLGTTYAAYDDFGNATRIVDSDGVAWSMAYDPEGQLLEVIENVDQSNANKTIGSNSSSAKKRCDASLPDHQLVCPLSPSDFENKLFFNESNQVCKFAAKYHFLLLIFNFVYCDNKISRFFLEFLRSVDYRICNFFFHEVFLAGLSIEKSVEIRAGTVRIPSIGGSAFQRPLASAPASDQPPELAAR